jgi:hypothetical protein
MFKTTDLTESFKKTFCKCSKSMDQQASETQTLGKTTKEPQTLVEEIPEPQTLSKDVLEENNPESFKKEVLGFC